MKPYPCIGLQCHMASKVMVPAPCKSKALVAVSCGGPRETMKCGTAQSPHIKEASVGHSEATWADDCLDMGLPMTNTIMDLAASQRVDDESMQPTGLFWMQPLKMWKHMEKKWDTYQQKEYKKYKNVKATARLCLFGGSWCGNRKRNTNWCNKIGRVWN